VRKANLEAVDLKHLRRETSILQNLCHPNIIKLYEVHENDYEIHFVMELVSDGLDLFDRICERGQYSERDAAYVIGQIVRGVEYLHSHGTQLLPSQEMAQQHNTTNTTQHNNTTQQHNTIHTHTLIILLNEGIVHRDLKPENLLTERHGVDDIIKLCDFGFAKKWDYSNLLTACGSPGYVGM